MDHLPWPSNSSSGSVPEVPCICDDDGYTGPFLDYPAYKGWSNDELWCRRAWNDTFQCDNPHCTAHRCACTRPHSVEDNAAFLQNWLFFGLARALFDDFVHGVHVVPRSRFLRVNDNGQTVLCTASIRELAARWYEVNIHSTSHLFMGERNFKDILTLAHAVYMFVTFSTTIDPMLLLPMGLLGEFLV